jgi:hypothetical protein
VQKAHSTYHVAALNNLYARARIQTE